MTASITADEGGSAKIEMRRLIRPRAHLAIEVQGTHGRKLLLGVSDSELSSLTER